MEAAVDECRTDGDGTKDRAFRGATEKDETQATPANVNAKDRTSILFRIGAHKETETQEDCE